MLGRRRRPGRDRRLGLPARDRRHDRRSHPGARPRPASAACTSSSPPPPSAACFESAHDVSDGGVAVAIAESAILGSIGVDAPDPGDPFTRGRRAGGRLGAPRAPRRARGSWPATCRCAGSAPSAASASPWPAPRSASPRRPRSTRARSRARSARMPTDVRRLRHLRPTRRPRPRRRPAHLLRALRAPAPRPGERRHRRVGRLAGDGDEGHGPREPGVRRAAPVGPLRPYRDRPCPLLDHRLDGVAERPADRAPFEPRGDRARPQRQPDQHVGPPRRPARAARAPRVDLRHRGDRRADRPAPVRRPGRRRGRHHVAHRGRIRRGRPLGAGPGRLPRPRRHPPAGRRAPRRRLGAGLRDLRARPHRRPPRARAAARRARGHRRAGRPLPPGRVAETAGRSASSSSSTSPAPTPRWRARPCTTSAVGWARGWPTRRRPTPTS